MGMNLDLLAERRRLIRALEQIVALRKIPVRKHLTSSHNATNGNDWLKTAKEMAAIAEVALKGT